MPLPGGLRLASVRTGSDAGKGSSAPPGPEVHVTGGPTRGSATSAPPILAEDRPLQEFRGAARFLQTAPLGPGIELVVGPEPEPGAQELLAFARASGIGADALERLFGPQGPAAPRASGLPVPLPPGTIRPEPVSVTSTGVAPGVPTLAAAGAFAAASAYWPRPEDGSAVRLRAGASPVQTSLPLAGALPDAAAPSVPVSSPVTVAPLATSSVTQPATLPAGPMSLVMASGQPPGYAEMVHRVSQAVASRMVVGLREGNTSLSMRLEPRALGAVEVEMALHEGRLEATLAAPLAATRELLTEGLARLRDTLGQMGMNVAVLTVSDGLGARSDGKPTRQRSGDAAYTRWNAVDGRVEAATSEARPRGGPGGLDVWA